MDLVTADQKVVEEIYEFCKSSGDNWKYVAIIDMIEAHYERARVEAERLVSLKGEDSWTKSQKILKELEAIRGSAW